MKKLLLCLIFLSIATTGLAQYGRLEPLRPNDSTYLVLRTPPETLVELSKSENKQLRNTGVKIQSVEKQLQLMRSYYLMNQVLSPDMNMFLKNIESLNSNGVNVNYYVQEMLLYSRQRQ